MEKTINSLTDEKLDQLVLKEYPYPIAVNYGEMLGAKNWEACTRKGIEVFEYSLRIVTLFVLSQYIIRDVDKVFDSELDRKLSRNLSQASLGQWVEFLFLILQAYRGKRKLFFVPELYDLYWDTSKEQLRTRKGFQSPFYRLVEIRNDLAHRMPPKDERGWEILGREVLSHLHTILKAFSFLKSYDLIRIIEKKGDKYSFERYTGTKISIHREGLKEGEEFHSGWFYLSRQNHSILSLHPLFIFWYENKDTKLVIGEQDAALYERMMQEAVEYIATVLREVVRQRDPDLLAHFREMIYYNLERINARKRRGLTWSTLRQAVGEVTREQMGVAQEKYQSGIYLQREDVFRKFMDFLYSDKGAFVITGKSGVGKTNFVMSLIDEFASQENFGILIYNGARLNVPAEIDSVIYESLAKYVSLETENDLFEYLEKNGEMVKKQLIIIFDAVNENIDGKKLLWKIDQMIGKAHYPWLKVVITSRPQAWEKLKRGLRLAEECYYRTSGSDEYWFELREFTVRMEPFEREELPKVYEKYRQAYNLRTEYEKITQDLRTVMRDPLMLRLISEIYRGQAIPEQVRIGEIYEHYIQALLYTERLYEEDIILLEHELIPLMVSENHFDNKITAVQISSTRTRDGRSLWELIRSDDLLSDKRRVNESYMRLVDAGILTEQGSFADYEITFTYERFYDYYCGRRLIQLIDQSTDSREMVYIDLFEKLKIYPFLWGPINTGLFTELERNNTHLVIKLARISDDAIAHQLIIALSEYGRDDLNYVRTILAILAKTKERIGRRQLAHPKEFKDISPSLFTTKKILVEVATNLKVLNFLVQTACDQSASVRMLTIQNIQWLWNQNSEFALETLVEISKQIKGIIGIPHPAVIESLLGTSALIAFEHSDKITAIKPLQLLWKGILNQLLLIREDEQGMRGRLRRRIRGFSVSFLSKLMIGLVERLPSFSEFNLSELSDFLHLHRAEKQRYVKLLPYLSPEYGNLQDIYEDLIALAKSRDTVASYLVYLLLTRENSSFSENKNIICRVFQEALNMNPPGPSTHEAINAMFYITSVEKEYAHEAYDLLEQFVWQFYELSGCVYWTKYQAYQPIVIAKLLMRYFDVFGEYYPESLIMHLAEENRSDQFSLCRFLLGYSASVENINSQLYMISVYGYPRLALKVVQLLLDTNDDVTKRELSRFLARLRRNHQDLVDDFIEEFKFPAEVVRKEEAFVSAQTIGNVIAATVMPFIPRIQSQPLVFREIQAIITGALKCHSLAQLFDFIIRRIVNFVYGSPVFDLPEIDEKIERIG